MRRAQLQTQVQRKKSRNSREIEHWPVDNDLGKLVASKLRLMALVFLRQPIDCTPLFPFLAPPQ
jgi:hypothetical protein